MLSNILVTEIQQYKKQIMSFDQSHFLQKCKVGLTL